MIPLLLLLSGCGYQELPKVKDPCAEWSKPGTYTFTMKVGKQERSALVHVPRSKGPRDLVVALHGLKGSSSVMQSLSQFNALADDRGFVVAYPQGTGGWRDTSWNAGLCCDDAAQKKIDDVAFLDALAAKLKKRTCAEKVHAAGFSNGSAMVQRWACESTAVDSVVAAGAPILFDGACKGGPVPITYFHGTDDEICPMEGGGPIVDTPPVKQAFEKWRAINQCSDQSTTKDGCESWSCAADTTFCTLKGHKHTWPQRYAQATLKSREVGGGGKR